MTSANTVHYDRWFQLADSDRDGRVTGGDAVAFFGRSGLPRETLATVWELANDRRLGYLDRLAFHKAMDLISLAQSVGADSGVVRRTESAWGQPGGKAGVGAQGISLLGASLLGASIRTLQLSCVMITIVLAVRVPADGG